MKKFGLTILLILVVTAFTVNTGCKKSDKGFNISDGTWGFYLQTNAGTSALVYDFQGSETQGEVYYRHENRGTYTVSGNIANFTVNHYDPENNLFVYVYRGTFGDYYNMSGSFSVTNPDGSVTSGTFTAER
ncbi:MAG: hypothetical protein GY950_16090 [bacterium]|nr:hypothetical protein [bacterium]